MLSSRETITVMLVENVPHLLKHLQKTLGLIAEVDVVNTSMSAQEALESIRDMKPEVALVEYNLPDMNGINFTEIIRRDFPETQIVLISQDNYTDIVLAAIRAGACDFITHEASVKELTDVLKRAAKLAAQDRQKSTLIPSGKDTGAALPKGGNGKVITFYSPKGGTGVTTIAANFALALMEITPESRVVLVDGSMQFGDLHLLFNELGQLSVMDLVPRLYDLDNDLVQNVMLLNRATGIHILPAPPRPEFAENITGEHFGKIIEFLRFHNDYIIINTDSFISEPVLAALDAAEIVVLVGMQQINTIRNLRMFLELWDAIGMNKNRLSLIINRYDSMNPITNERIGERLKLKIDLMLPEDLETTQRSDAIGQPFMKSARNTPLSRGIIELAGQIKVKADAMKESEERRARLFAAP